MVCEVFVHMWRRKQKNREMKWKHRTASVPCYVICSKSKGSWAQGPSPKQTMTWTKTLTLNTRRQISSCTNICMYCCNLSLKLRVVIFVICLAGENHSIYLHSAESEWDFFQNSSQKRRKKDPPSTPIYFVNFFQEKNQDTDKLALPDIGIFHCAN